MPPPPPLMVSLSNHPIPQILKSQKIPILTTPYDDGVVKRRS